MISLKKLQSVVIKISRAHSIVCCENCEYCNQFGAQRRLALTAYHWDKKLSDIDPNRDVFLCAKCYQGYVDYWTEMWEEYRSSQGV